jgi:hypothetical protein
MGHRDKKEMLRPSAGAGAEELTGIAFCANINNKSVTAIVHGKEEE